MTTRHALRSRPRRPLRLLEIPARILPSVLAGVLCAVALQACAAKTDRLPAVTLLDFRTQNVERLHAGIERLMGEDSAGLAAREYLDAYEEELVRYVPSGTGTIAEAHPNDPYTGVDPYWGGSDDEPAHPRNIQIIFSRLHSSQRDARAQPGMRRLIAYLDGRRLAAMIDLRKNHDAFGSEGSLVSAKMGVANAYVALTAMPPPNELDLIVDLVEPLLAELVQ